MKKTILFVLLFLLTAGCASTSQIESIVRDKVAPQYSAANTSFHLAGTRNIDNGVIAIFTIDDTTELDADTVDDRNTVVGFAVLEKGIFNWKWGMDGVVSNPLNNGNPIVYGYALPTAGAVSDAHYGVLYGQKLTANVTAVQLTLEDGTTLRDDTTDGVFAFYLPRGVNIASMQILGNNDELLKLIDNPKQD